MPKETVRIILVEWTDSISYGASVWTRKDDILKSNELPLIQSVGFLLRETEDSLVIAGHMGDGSVSGDMNIPKVAIKKRKWVK